MFKHLGLLVGLLIGLLLVLIISAVGQVSRADAPASTFYVRALGGVGIVNNSGGSNFSYGLGIGYKFMPQVGAGVDYTYNTFTVPSPLTANLSLILANIKYYFADVAGLSAGFKLGVGTTSVSGAGAISSASASNFTWGPTVNYDYSLNSNWAVGAEANLLWVSNSTPSTNIVQILANVKYWF
jgi:hypothetical protein